MTLSHPAHPTTHPTTRNWDYITVAPSIPQEWNFHRKTEWSKIVSIYSWSFRFENHSCAWKRRRRQHEKRNFFLVPLYTTLGVIFYGCERKSNVRNDVYFREWFQIKLHPQEDFYFLSRRFINLAHFILRNSWIWNQVLFPKFSPNIPNLRILKQNTIWILFYLNKLCIWSMFGQRRIALRQCS